MKKDNKKIKELQTWYKGNEKGLKKFYSSDNHNDEAIDLGLFWSKGTKSKNITVHYGRPKLIVNEIVDMLIPNITYVGNDIFNEKINEITKGEYFKTFVEKVTTDLVSSEVAYAKISYDLPKDENGIELSDEKEVFLERINPLFVEEVKFRNKVIAYEISKLIVAQKGLVSKDETVFEDVELTLIERHTKGKITYMVVDSEGEKVDYSIYKFDFVLPEDKEFTNKDFISIFSMSVKVGALSPSLRHFDSHDEIFSQQRNETRKNKQRNYIPETAVLKNQSGTTVGWDDMEYDYQITGTPRNTKEDTKVEIPKIQTVNVDIDPETRYLVQQRATDKIIIENAGLDNASFSPSTNESGKSKEEQYKRTLKTYKRYGNKLIPFLTNVLTAYLNVEESQNKETTQEVIEKIYLEEYVKPTLNDRIKTYGSNEAQATLSLETRVRGVMPNDSTDEEIQAEIEKIKKEQGLENDFDLDINETE